LDSKLLSVFDGSRCLDDLTPREGLQVEPLGTGVGDAPQSLRDRGDWAFDRFLPKSLGVVSAQFWTPIEVATRVADWLDDFNIRTVMDIGSGVGKFCVVAALSANCNFLGVEQRPRLVRTARHLARLFRVQDRVRFLHGEFGDDPLPIADAYYLYNPFGENLVGPVDHLDEDVELGEERYFREVRALERFLKEAPTGTFVVTYNGFGAELPRSYTELRVDRALPNVLRLSRKDG
jgi:predicted RNA methylase